MKNSDQIFFQVVVNEGKIDVIYVLMFSSCFPPIYFSLVTEIELNCSTVAVFVNLFCLSDKRSVVL